MCHDTHRRDAASIQFDLSGYRVASAWRDEDGQRVVLIETFVPEFHNFSTHGFGERLCSSVKGEHAAALPGRD